jgi:hypothetical protein
MKASKSGPATRSRSASRAAQNRVPTMGPTPRRESYYI